MGRMIKTVVINLNYLPIDKPDNFSENVAVKVTFVAYPDMRGRSKPKWTG